MDNARDLSLEEWSFRAALYELLALCFLAPTRSTSEALASGEFAEACGELLAGIGLDGNLVSDAFDALRPYLGRGAEDVYHEIRGEHTRLFVGVIEPLVSPYLGVWDSRRKGVQPVLAIAPESMAIERFMRGCGVANNAGRGFNEPIDHIGAVLEFAEFLCLVNARAVGHPEGFVVPDDAYQTFLEKHLSKFYGPFSGKVLEETRLPLYRFAANILRVFLEREIERHHPAC